MSHRPLWPYVTALAIACTASAEMFVVARVAQAQAQQQPQQTSPAPQENTGLLNEIGRLLRSPADLLPSLPKSEPAAAPPAEPAPPVAAPAPPPDKQPPASVAAPAPAPAAEPASSRMFPGMANGREACPASSGGGPNCQAATDKLCQSKGYKSGRSISTDSAYTCSARLARAEGGKACGTEYYVTSAFCQ